jgi:hypothetical protein
MSSGDEVKNILYSTIEDIGKERIRSDTTSDITLSDKYINTIMGRCISKIDNNSKTGHSNETLMGLCEALLHFMLTVCTLPSERKIQVKEGLLLDIVIPNLQTLKMYPLKSVIIYMIKDDEDSTKISRFEYLQPEHRNIWLISSIPLSTKKYKIYDIVAESGRVHNRFSSIITDIDSFLKETGDRTLRLIH